MDTKDKLFLEHAGLYWDTLKRTKFLVLEMIGGIKDIR